MGENRKPTLIYPVVVEGKYDKIRLSSLFDGQILTTDGFGVFKNGEKKEFFRRLAEKSPLIVLSDSDGAGGIIRRFFKDLLPKDRLIELYIPQIEGKEKRKDKPSAEGYLGVEGMEKDLLLGLLAPYLSGAPAARGADLKRIELYELGYEGASGSREKRRALCRRAGLPQNLSTTALLDALNLLYTRDEIDALLRAE